MPEQNETDRNRETGAGTQQPNQGYDVSANEGRDNTNPSQVTRNESANPSAGGRANRDPVEGARDQYGTEPDETEGKS